MSEVKDEGETVPVKEEGEKVETTQEKNEEEPKTEEEKEEKQENNMDKDGFENVPKSVKFQLFALFFFLGIFNHLGNILVLTGGRIIAYELKLQKVFTLYTSSSSIFAVCTRMINSRLFIKVSYQKRMVCVCFLMIAGYASMFAVFHLYENQLHEYNVLCFALTFIPSFFLGSCYALGEGAIMAYLRNYPPTLIAGFSSGTGLSGLFSASLNFASQLVSIKYKWFYLVLAPTGFIYLGLFYWSYKLYLKYFFIDQSAADLEKAQDEQKAPLVTDDKEETKGPETDNPDESADMPIAKDANLSKVQDKTMDSMNKKNKELTCENFCKVMGMAGRYIINMGLIYLIQFFCQNALFVKDALRVEIPFLPDGCDDPEESKRTYNKGRFEFVNLFFQLGMWTSKTLIRVVRHIQPIEIYTSVVTAVTVFASLEYVFHFSPWYVFPIVMFVLGFFGGG